MHPSNMSLYPAMDTPLEAVKFIESQCPIQTPNDLFPLLMMYHNTLLKSLVESVGINASAAELRVTSMNIQETITGRFINKPTETHS